MSDKVVRALALGGNVRVIVAKTTDMVTRAQEIHQTYPTSSAALGRVMSVATIMGATLKDERERMVVEIKSDGDIKHILVNADNKGFVRGLIDNPNVLMIKKDSPKLDVGGAVGNGYLRVTQQYDDTATFSSQVELQTGEIGDDFAYYYVQSEQIPTALSVGVLVNEDLTIKSAGAILIQLLPSATDVELSMVENVVNNLKPVSELMIDYEAKDLCEALFDDVEILGETDVAYFCGCNRTQMKDVLRTLNADDLNDLINNDHGATLECHYCHTKYTFKEDELKELLEERSKN